MKKQILLYTILLLAGIQINDAQAQLRSTFGIRGGLNLASFSDSKQEVDSRRKGLLVGLYGDFQLFSSAFSIQPEASYVQKGAEINGTKIKLSYLEIPLLAKVTFARRAIATPYLYAGPYVAFKLNYDEEPAGDLDSHINNTDYGLVFGAGVNVHKLNLGVRYSLGLNEIFEFEEARNNGIAIVGGINL